MKCSLCGNEEATTTVLGNHFCDECNGKIRLLEKNDPKTVAFFRNESNYPMANPYTKKYISGLIERNKTRVENTEQIVYHENIQRIDQEKRRSDIKLTTCNSIDGYKATKQFGLVFGETVFKTGFFKSLGASMTNIAQTIKWGDQELTGTGEIMDNARDYAINKMIDRAIQKGANAIIGIDTESTLSAEFVHITIYGTAVFIEKES